MTSAYAVFPYDPASWPDELRRIARPGVWTAGAWPTGPRTLPAWWPSPTAAVTVTATVTAGRRPRW